MNINRQFLYFLLFVILLLLVGLAYLSRPRPAASSASPAAAPAPSVPLLEDDDFTVMLEHPQTALPSAREILNRPGTERVSRSGGVASRPASGLKTSYAAGPVSSFAVRGGGEQNSFRAPVFPPAGKGSSSVSSRSSALPSAPRFPASSAGAPRFGGAASALEAYRRGSEQRGKLFDAIMPPQTRREQKALNQRLQSFSAGLERAIAAAALPKSKRDQNIEKYLARSRGEAASLDNEVYAAKEGQAGGGAAAEVLGRLAAQSQGIVEDVRSSYGDGAAEQAKSIMDNFQKEMGETLNAPGDPQEKQIRAQAVNNKYNSQLRQLNDNAALVKMEEQLRAENEEYLKKIGESFGPQTAAEMRPVMESFLLKRKQIWSTPQSEEAALAQTLALDEEQRKAQEEIVRRTAAQSTANLTAVQNEVTRQRILEEARKAEEGASSPLFRQSEQARVQNEAAWKKEGEQIVSGFQSFGPEAAAEAKRQMDNLLSYRRQLRERAEKEGMSIAEVNRLDMEKTEETNRNLQQLRISQVEEQYNKGYEEQFKNLPEETKNAARSVWQRYNKERAALLEKKLNPQQYQAHMEEIGRREAEELQQLEQNAGGR